MDAELRRVKRIFDEKRSEVVAKEEKIDFYEENYGNLIAEYKKEVQKREYFINEYTAMPKDMTREELSKMIFEIKKRAKQNESTTSSRVDELTGVKSNNVSCEKDLKMLNQEINARIGEGENKKKKNDQSFDKLRDIFRKLCVVFEKTKEHMLKYSEVKTENRNVEDRIQELERNNYKETTDTLKAELQMLDE